MTSCSWASSRTRFFRLAAGSVYGIVKRLGALCVDENRAADYEVLGSLCVVGFVAVHQIHQQPQHPCWLSQMNNTAYCVLPVRRPGAIDQP